MGLTVIASTAATPEVGAKLDAAAEARGVSRSVALREITDRWAANQPELAMPAKNAHLANSPHEGEVHQQVKAKGISEYG
jgi:hypothetical protein